MLKRNDYGGNRCSMACIFNTVLLHLSAAMTDSFEGRRPYSKGGGVAYWRIYGTLCCPSLFMDIPRSPGNASVVRSCTKPRSNKTEDTNTTDDMFHFSRSEFKGHYVYVIEWRPEDLRDWHWRGEGSRQNNMHLQFAGTVMRRQSS